MRQSNGCSTSATRSSAAKQWFEQLAQKKKKTLTVISVYSYCNSVIIYQTIKEKNIELKCKRFESRKIISSMPLM